MTVDPIATGELGLRATVAHVEGAADGLSVPGVATTAGHHGAPVNAAKLLRCIHDVP